MWNPSRLALDYRVTDRLMSERQANGVASSWVGLIYGLTQWFSANLSSSSKVLAL